MRNSSAGPSAARDLVALVEDPSGLLGELPDWVAWLLCVTALALWLPAGAG